MCKRQTEIVRLGDHNFTQTLLVSFNFLMATALFLLQLLFFIATLLFIETVLLSFFLILIIFKYCAIFEWGHFNPGGLNPSHYIPSSST